MVKIFAHRGYKKKFPENSMLAFRKAIEYGADGIELDVHLTADEQLVVIHDDTLDRTTNRSGTVKDLTFAELRKAKIRTGRFTYERIPLLKDVLDLLKDTPLELNIEIKGKTGGVLEARLIELLARYSMDERLIISSFQLESVRRIKQLQPALETAYLYSRYVDRPWQLKSVYLFDGIHTNTFYTSEDFAAKIAAEQLNVRLYTVNRAVDIAYWLKTDVDAIITDDVELAVNTKKFI
ncbi:glycerophosphodiester phosphodiesterase [Macrococcus equipercicus]|uniref:Glycerophosphodiester phosphodiesterase n=1 Tax=Macrococcus equipercicus TaxID=69967 RepID=A0ABQ6RA27_9STAP|nr:glycerophosphodiester phosphodiesterase family protein [Macrococcus equipercicus]KAA1040135.1 glycerophosphodiester phosphodiesterase [Macrococcus equipercicus]